MPQIEPCPVCGYGGLLEPPRDFSICPCCGTQFDLDDDDVTHEELFRRWYNAGAVWWSRNHAKPLGWSLKDQLTRAGLSGHLAPELPRMNSSVPSNLETLPRINEIPNEHQRVDYYRPLLPSLTTIG